MEFLVCFLLCILIFILTLVFIRTKGPGKLPPGPAPWPVVGNLFHLGGKPHKSLAELAETYGPIMSLKLGRITTIVVSSADLAKEVLQKHDAILSNRMAIDAVRVHKHDEVGLPWLPVGPLWRNLRKVCNSYIFTTQKLDANQDLRRKKIQDLLADVRESCRAGEAVDIGQAAFRTTVNALSNTIFSVDLSDWSSDAARELKGHVRSIMDEAGKPNLADYFPMLRKMDPQGIKRRMTIYMGKMLDLSDRLICERMKLRRMQDYVPANDMLDTLLNMKEEQGEEIDIDQIKHLFLVLFVAGADTTSSTLEWAMAELLQNPKALSRVRAELEQTIGKGKLPEESDITRLPYFQAVIKETFRLHPSAPLLLPRKARADVEIRGFLVPKDAQVFVNAWAIGRDPSIWEDPNSFKPERFLGSEIEARGHSFELIPFGSGRRICIGLPLAMRMLHLMLGSLIQSFDWKLEHGKRPEEMDMEEKFGITLQKANPLRVVPIPI